MDEVGDSAGFSNMMQDDDGSTDVYSQLELQNKLVEADTKISGDLASRNLQNGNISKADYKYLLNEMRVALRFQNTPFEKGGHILQRVGVQMMRIVDMEHIMSGSRSAKKFDALTQKRQLSVFENREAKAKKGVFNKFSNSQQQY